MSFLYDLPQEKRSHVLLQSAGLQLPGGLPKDGFTHGIREKSSSVNRKFQVKDLRPYILHWRNDARHQKSSIRITSSTIEKGSKGQLLNMEDSSSPQPTPDASFDSDAADTILSESDGKNNTTVENSSKNSQGADTGYLISAGFSTVTFINREKQI